jgi:hypothetical protein
LEIRMSEDDSNIVELRPLVDDSERRAQAFLSVEAAICDLHRRAEIEEWLSDNGALAELVACLVNRLADQVHDLKRRYYEAAKALD